MWQDRISYETTSGKDMLRLQNTIHDTFQSRLTEILTKFFEKLKERRKIVKKKEFSQDGK